MATQVNTNDSLQPDKVKKRVQTLIVTCSVFLLIGKFIAYFLTNSVGVFTDAMESIVNVTAGFISLFAIYQASKPKDKKHPFGHGKIELISASTEGILILIAGGIIIYEGIQRLFEPSEINKLDIGIMVVAFAGLTNYLLGWYSIKQGQKHDSIALVAGGKHLQSDTYSTIGLVIGLLLLYFTKLSWIDSALAIIFGTIIAVTGINILRETINNLIDAADRDILDKITKAVSDDRKEDWINVHNLKMIKSGSNYFIDCDLTLPWYYNIDESHKTCDDLKENLKSVFTNETVISIHTDSCHEKFCASCNVSNCAYRKESFVAIAPLTIDNLISSEKSM